MPNNTKNSEKKQMHIKQTDHGMDTEQRFKTGSASTSQHVSKPDSAIVRALVLVMVLLVLCVLSAFFIFTKKQPATGSLHAEIYQNGELLQTLDLSAVTEPYSFTVEYPDGGFNTITVRPGAIGICDADCPDKLCVSMGYADSSLLPIVCLPHSLVIQVKEKDGSVIDGMTY